MTTILARRNIWKFICCFGDLLNLSPLSIFLSIARATTTRKNVSDRLKNGSPYKKPRDCTIFGTKVSRQPYGKWSFRLFFSSSLSKAETTKCFYSLFHRDLTHPSYKQPHFSRNSKWIKLNDILRIRPWNSTINTHFFTPNTQLLQLQYKRRIGEYPSIHNVYMYLAFLFIEVGILSSSFSSSSLRSIVVVVAEMQFRRRR